MRCILAEDLLSMKVKKLITKHQLDFIIKKYRIRCGQITIRSDGYIDVKGNVKICDTNLQKLPLKFGNVYGDFLCHSNKLATLKGCPRYVGGDFNCYNNVHLKTLKYGPEEVGGDYSCHENSLIDLKGSPKEIKGNFNAFLNQLTSLQGAPVKIGKNCYLHHNNLTSLEGTIVHIGGSFYISANTLNTLEGCPKFIGDILSFDNDVKLDLGNENCIVKRIVIQMQETNVAVVERCLPEVVISNQQYLPTVVRYAKYISLYDAEGDFNEGDFIDFITEVKDGLR